MVSAGSSPIDGCKNHDEYPIGTDGRRRAGVNPDELRLIAATFPAEALCGVLPVRFEWVRLSNDQKSLLGSAAVTNLSFQKSVSCGFTFDSWKIISEVMPNIRETFHRPMA